MARSLNMIHAVGLCPFKVWNTRISWILLFKEICCTYGNCRHWFVFFNIFLVISFRNYTNARAIINPNLFMLTDIHFSASWLNAKGLHSSCRYLPTIINTGCCSNLFIGEYLPSTRICCSLDTSLFLAKYLLSLILVSRRRLPPLCLRRYNRSEQADGISCLGHSRWGDWDTFSSQSTPQDHILAYSLLPETVGPYIEDWRLE